MADFKIDNDNIPDHLIIDVDVEAPRLESDDDHAVHEISADVETTAALNTAGAGAVTTTGDGVVSATGAWAITTAGAGAITTAGARSMAVSTAGAGSVTVSGGTAAGGINTSGAGSVNTYTGVSPPGAKGNDVEQDYTKKIPWTVGVMGGLTQATAASAVVYRSPRGVAVHGGEVAYLVGIASVFVAGLAEIVAAFWVSIDTQKRGATGKKILCLSVFTLLLAIALVGVAIVPKK